MSEEVAEVRAADACPSEIMPTWLAQLVPHIDDCGSDDAWDPMVRRFASLAGRWTALGEPAWQRVRVAFTVTILDDVASTLAGNERDAVRQLCRLVASGDRPAVAQLANDLVPATELVADGSAAWWAETVAWSMRAPLAVDVLGVATAATHELADPTAWWDSMTTALFDLIEAEIGAGQAR
jgi:hypothetical protein